MASHPDQDLIEKRYAAYQEAWRKKSVDDILSFMAEDVSISDFGVNVHNLNKTAARTFFANMFASAGDLTMSWRSINGHKYFTAHEWEATFKYIKEMVEVSNEKAFGPEKADGRLMRMVGVSLMWWNDEGKIVKNIDYTKVLEN